MQDRWYLDDHDLFAVWKQAGGSPQTMSELTGTPGRTIRRHLKRLRDAEGVIQDPAGLGPRPLPTAQRGAETAGARIDDDSALLVSRPNPRGTATLTPDELMREHGLDPAEWDYTSTLNAWDALTGEGGVTTLAQLKLSCRRRVPLDLVIPARESGYQRKPLRPRKASKRKPLLIALPSDQHCPHEDPGLDECWQYWVAEHAPDRIVGLGDLTNYAKPSRHRPNMHERHNDGANECGQAGYNWWRRTIDAHPRPDALECGQLPGNHDLRPGITCLEKTPDLYDVRRPGEEHPWWDFAYLAGLDKLGVTYHRPEGEYHAAKVFVAPGLMVTHGTHSGPLGGAPKAASKHEKSRAQGHDHKQAVTYVVRYDDEDRAHQSVHVSVGTMARRDLGYTPDPDTQQGFATVVLHEDGYWNVELARYDDQRRRLVWRDSIYTA